MAAIFDHESLAGIALQIGKRFGERFGLGEQVGQSLCEAAFHIGEWQANRTSNPRAFVRIRDQHHGFTHTVTLKNRVTCSFFEKIEGLSQQWGRTRNKQAHVFNRLLGKFFI